MKRQFILFGLQFFAVGLVIGVGAGALGYRQFAKAQEPEKKQVMYPRALAEFRGSFSTKGRIDDQLETFSQMPHCQD